MEDEAQAHLQGAPAHARETASQAEPDDDDEGYGVIAATGPMTRSGKPSVQPLFECPICDSKVEQKNATRHMLDQHRNSPVLNHYETCAICGGLFLRHKLTPHVHKVHPGSPTGLEARGKPIGRPDKAPPGAKAGKGRKRSSKPKRGKAGG